MQEKDYDNELVEQLARKLCRASRQDPDKLVFITTLEEFTTPEGVVKAFPNGYGEPFNANFYLHPLWKYYRCQADMLLYCANPDVAIKWQTSYKAILENSDAKKS